MVESNWRDLLDEKERHLPLAILLENPSRRTIEILIKHQVALEQLFAKNSWTIDKLLVIHGHFLEEIAKRKEDTNTWKLIVNTGKHLNTLAMHDNDIVNLHIINKCQENNWEIPSVIYQSEKVRTKQKLENMRSGKVVRRKYRRTKFPL